MMLISKCPLRISLVGGSTDLEEFIDTTGYGSVINFPCNLYTYIVLFTDKNGYNQYSNKYIINYTTREEVKSYKDIKNDVAREVLSYFDCPPINISFNSDVFSSGSGLASSSSYVISLVNAINNYKKLNLSKYEICHKALEIERKFNPLTGRQDVYGCGLGGFKRLEFFPEKKVSTTILDDAILNKFDIYLVYTGITRSSTEVLKSLDLKKSKKQIDLVESMEKCIINNDDKSFCEIINEGWINKKESSALILKNDFLREMDERLSLEPDVKAHKLCGAGGGGYFLVFFDKGKRWKKWDKIKNFEKASFKIDVNERGVSSQYRE